MSAVPRVVTCALALPHPPPHRRNHPHPRAAARTCFAVRIAYLRSSLICSIFCRCASSAPSCSTFAMWRSYSTCCCRIFTARISCVLRCVSSILRTAFISSDCSRAILLARICLSASTLMRARFALSIAADMMACCVLSSGSEVACVSTMALPSAGGGLWEAPWKSAGVETLVVEVS